MYKCVSYAYGPGTKNEGSVLESNHWADFGFGGFDFGSVNHGPRCLRSYVSTMHLAPADAYTCLGI